MEKKRAAYAVYAFCRYADDLVDQAGPGTEDLALAIGEVTRRFDAIAGGTDLSLPFAPAFSWAVGRYGLTREPFLDLLKGVAMDLQRVELQTWEELRNYCYHVASVVGLIMARIFELRDPAATERAVELGIAMQLTNILRDIREDLERDRVYLPAEELREFGLCRKDLESGRMTPEFRSFMKFQIARAREFYKSSEAGIPSLADDGSQLTVWLMRTVYAGILDEIERQDLDVFAKRASTSKLKKLALAALSWWRWRRSRGGDA